MRVCEGAATIYVSLLEKGIFLVKTKAYVLVVSVAVKWCVSMVGKREWQTVPCWLCTMTGGSCC